MMPCWRETDNMTGGIQGIQGRYIVVCCVLKVSLQRGGGIGSGYKLAAELDAQILDLHGRSWAFGGWRHQVVEVQSTPGLAHCRGGLACRDGCAVPRRAELCLCGAWCHVQELSEIEVVWCCSNVTSISLTAASRRRHHRRWKRCGLRRRGGWSLHNMLYRTCSYWCR